MKVSLKIVLVASLSLTVAGCAAQETKFTKLGIDDKFVKRDSDKCWKKARSAAVNATAVAAGAATTVAIGLLTANPAVMVGGLIGQGIGETDPKNPRKRAAHDACMKNKGYKVAKS